MLRDRDRYTATAFCAAESRCPGPSFDAFTSVTDDPGAASPSCTLVSTARTSGLSTGSR
jgi:hypothetical protein